MINKPSLRGPTCRTTEKARSNLYRIYNRLYASFGPQHWWPGETPLEVIVGAILTQNTAWTNVERAIANLKAAGALESVAAMRSIPLATLTRLIRPAGYYNVKAARLRNCMEHIACLIDTGLRGASSPLAASTPLATPHPSGCSGKLDTFTLRTGLLGVNGIGPETADSILLYAFNRPVFVVDAYTRRVFSRHGILDGKDDYHAIQRFFMDRLPHESRLFNEYHALIVRLAKEYCRTKPRCAGCPLERLKRVGC